MERQTASYKRTEQTWNYDKSAKNEKSIVKYNKL